MPRAGEWRRAFTWRASRARGRAETGGSSSSTDGCAFGYFPDARENTLQSALGTAESCVGSRRAGPSIARLAPASGPPAGCAAEDRSAPLTRFDRDSRGWRKPAPRCISGVCARIFRGSMGRLAPALWLTALVCMPAAAAPAADSLSVASPTGRDYLAEARAAFTPANRAYQRQRVTLALVTPLFGILAGFGLLATGLARRFRDFAEARARGRYLRVLIFFALYSLVTFVVFLPVDWYSSFALEHQYGLSSQTLADWTADEVKTLVFQVVVVGVLPLLALAWRAVESSPRRWWLWLASGTAPVAVVAVLF